MGPSCLGLPHRPLTSAAGPGASAAQHGEGGEFSAGACGGTDRRVRPGYPEQAPAAALVPAQDVHRTPRREGAFAAGARLRRRRAGDLHGAGAEGSVPRKPRSLEGVRRDQAVPAFAYLLTALLFARSGLYAERAMRPGLSRIVGSLFQVAFVALLFAVVNGEHFSSYYLFYGSLAFAIFYVAVPRRLRADHGHRPAGSRLPAPRRAGRQRKAHRRRRPRDPGRAALADRDRRFPLAGDAWR